GAWRRGTPPPAYGWSPSPFRGGVGAGRISSLMLQFAAQGGVEAVGEAEEAGFDSVDAEAHAVVGDHRGDGGEQAESGGEQGFGDAGGDDREAGIVGSGDVGEAAHDPPYGAEQADEGRDRADRREDVQAGGERVDLGARHRLHDGGEAGAGPLPVDAAARGRAAPFGQAGAEHLGGGELFAAARLGEAVNA